MPDSDCLFVGGYWVVDIACANTGSTGYVNSQSTKLADVSLVVDKLEQTAGYLTIRFDPSLSLITQKPTNQDILLIPTSNAVFTITNQASVNLKRECSVKLLPAILDIPWGQNTLLSAQVLGSKITSVKFSSNHPDMISVYPASDNKIPYQVSLISSKNYNLSPIIITAKAYLGQNELCSGVAIVNPQTV